MKGQKNEILTRINSRNSSRLDVFYFLPTAHFLKQLPTPNGTFAFALTHKVKPSAKSKEPFCLFHLKEYFALKEENQKLFLKL
ncbi:MAG: hypothetical protein GYA41_11775 [Bacteroidales bacterium]|nr:hypothetical protein [Bacteroidales bacterium]